MPCLQTSSSCQLHELVLKIKLKVLAPDGSLTPVDGVLQTSPKTLDELRDAVSTHLVALRKLEPGVQVTIDGFSDGFDEDWAGPSV